MSQMAVCHVQKCSGQCSTKMEEEEERHHNNTPNADKNRKHLNRSIHLNEKNEVVFDQLRWSDKTKQERIDARLATQVSIQITDKNGRTYTKTAKIRKDAVTHFNMILGGSHERLDELFQESRAMMESGIPMERTPIGKWAMDNYLWLAEKAGGAENIVTFCLHLDETTPHIHATICPMYNGRLNSKKFIDGPQGLRRLQTEYAEKVSRKWGLERGVKGSKAKHQTLTEFYRRLEEASRTPGDAEAIEVDGKQFETQAPQITTRPPRFGNMDKWIDEENKRLAEQHKKHQQEMVEKAKEMLQQQVDADNRHYYEVQNTSLKMVRQNYRQLSKNSQLRGQIDAIAESRANEITKSVKNRAKEEIQTAKRKAKEDVEYEVNANLNDLVGPALAQVWQFIDKINGERTNLEDFESWEDYINAMIYKMKQANDALKGQSATDKNLGAADYRKKIYPILKRIWAGLDEIIGTKETLPKKTSEILIGIFNRLVVLNNDILPDLVEKETKKATRAFAEKNMKPKDDKIKLLETDLGQSKKENETLSNEVKQIRQMLSVFAADNPTIQAGRKAIYSVSTTAGRRGFSPEQAEDVKAAISLGNDQASRKSIAKWLLDNVFESVSQLSTYLAWFHNFAEPQTMTILNSLLDMGSSQGIGFGGGGTKDLSKKKKKGEIPDGRSMGY